MHLIRDNSVTTYANTNNQEFVAVALDEEGRLVGVPRAFAFGETTFMRFDLKAMMIHSLSKDGLRTLKLGEDGLPSGKPQLYPFDCGYIYDVFLDEATGKLYIACNKPPNLAPPTK